MEGLKREVTAQEATLRWRSPFVKEGCAVADHVGPDKYEFVVLPRARQLHT